MFKISATSEYALLLVQFLGKNEGNFNLEEIASRIKVPENCLRKVTGKLERAGIILSKKGRGGGIELLMKNTSVLQVLEAVGEDFHVAHCSGSCGKSKSCDLSGLLKNLERGFRSILSFTKL